jgi:diguanylate cyclase (GGDEF)-like protein
LDLKALMTLSETSQSRQARWIQRFLWIYWLVIILHLLAQLGAYIWVPSYTIESHDFYYHILLYPHLLMGAMVGISQLVYRFTPRYSFYALCLSGTIISMEIIHLNMDIRIIGAVMLLPIIASAVFFRLDLTWFTAGLQAVGFTVMYFWDYGSKPFWSPFDLIAIPIFFFMATLVASIIIINGQSLMADLEKTLLAKRDLMIENAIMSKLTKTDALTHLYNHISFHEFFELALEYGTHGQPFHLALIDIDYFKTVNDEYGHRVGDIVLARVARVIRDKIAPADVAARYGGEEFAVLLFEQTFEESYRIMESIRTTLEIMPHEELGGKPVTISVGLQGYAASDTKESLFEAVDTLLYAAKDAGRNRTVTPIHPATERKSLVLE